MEYSHESGFLGFVAGVVGVALFVGLFCALIFYVLPQLINEEEGILKLYYSNDTDLMDKPMILQMNPQPSSLEFLINHTEIIRLEPNGDIYVRGNLTTNDMQVYEGFVNFLNGSGCYASQEEEYD